MKPDLKLLLDARDFIITGQCPLPPENPFYKVWYQEQENLIKRLGEVITTQDVEAPPKD